jgi:hypothetical protein
MQLKQSHYRPEQALRAPGGFGSLISRQLAHEGGKVVTPKHRPLLIRGDILGISVRECFDLRAIVRPKGLCTIEPATFRLVAQCLNHLRHHAPRNAKHKSRAIPKSTSDLLVKRNALS